MSAITLAGRPITGEVDLNRIDKHYRQTITHFQGYLAGIGYTVAGTDARAFTDDISYQINLYLEMLKSQGLKNTTITLKRVALKHYVMHCLGNPIDNPVVCKAVAVIFQSNVKSYKTVYTLSKNKYLKRNEIEKLMDATTPRARLIIKTLFITGLRISEMINIKISNCLVSGDRVEITVDGKGNKQRRVLIPTKHYEEIKAIFKGDDYLFVTGGCIRKGRIYQPQPFDQCNLLKLIARESAKILGKRVTPHAMRHSFATYQLNVKKSSLPAISLYLGHSDVSITAKIYCHGTPDYNEIFDSEGELL